MATASIKEDACNTILPSIYSLYSPKRRNAIIFSASLGFLLQYCTTIYLPAIKMVQDDLNAGREVITATVSIHLLMGGLAALVWGPASDRFGRAPIYIIASVSYIGSCLGCMFAPTIELLLLFRALQGAAVAAFVATALGLTSDIFCPELRGRVVGACMITIGLGPVISPPIGGALAQVFGWRSVFVPLAAMCAVAGACLLLFMRRETHPYFVLKRLDKKEGGADHFQEWDEVMAQPPKFDAPWVPLKYLLERDLLPYALLAIITMGVLQSLLTELPLALAKPPYNLPASLIGVVLLANGLACVIAGPLGGFISDKLAAARPEAPTSRLVVNALIALATGPTGVLAVGWALHAKAHLALVTLAIGAESFSCSIYLPALFSYVTTIKQSASAAASGGIQSMMVFASALIVMVGSIAAPNIGYGWWFTVLACIQGLSNIFAYVMIVAKQRAAREATAALPIPAATVLIDGP